MRTPEEMRARADQADAENWGVESILTEVCRGQAEIAKRLDLQRIQGNTFRERLEQIISRLDVLIEQGRRPIDVTGPLCSEDGILGFTNDKVREAPASARLDRETQCEERCDGNGQIQIPGMPHEDEMYMDCPGCSACRREEK